MFESSGRSKATPSIREWARLGCHPNSTVFGEEPYVEVRERGVSKNRQKTRSISDFGLPQPLLLMA